MREEIPSLMYGKERSRGILYDVKILVVTDAGTSHIDRNVQHIDAYIAVLKFSTIHNDIQSKL